MNLLGAKLYDPTTAVSKATTAAAVMAALDTTNLRLAITVPAHGMVRFRLSGTLHGATTMPQILLGVMNGATVIGRMAPMTGGPSNAAATSFVKAEADFVVTGLTPGAMNVDAAFGVETGVASTGLKYGGPNNTTANDAFGAFVFEAWDPQPMQTNGQLVVDANGRVDVSKVAAAAISDVAAGVWDEPIAGHLGSGTTGAALNGAGAAGDPWGTALPGAYGAGTAGYIIGNRLDVAVSTRNSAVPLDAASTRAAVGLATANLDTQLSGISAKTTNLPSDPADESLVIAATDAIMTRLGAPAGASLSADVAAVKSDASAVKAKTDSLTFSVAGKLDVNVLVVNGVTITGTGAVGDTWRPTA